MDRGDPGRGRECALKAKALHHKNMTIRFKRTAQSEAYRISRVREALAGKPQPVEQRQRISRALKRAFAEGRMPPRTRESIKKGAAKLRGRKRPQEVVEKVRAKLRGKPHPLNLSPEQRALKSIQQAAYWAGLSEEERQKRIAKLRTIKHPAPSQAQREKHSRMLRGRKQPSAIVEKRAAPLRGRAQAHPLTKKGPTNQMSLHAALRSPDNIVYEFRNLTDWVRTNPDLFHPDDVIWRRPDSRRGMPFCRASKGLSALFNRSKHVRGSWKGWTVFSHTEQVTNQGEDLLERQTI